MTSGESGGWPWCQAYGGEKWWTKVAYVVTILVDEGGGVVRLVAYSGWWGKRLVVMSL